MIGKALGPYRVEALLGRGGMGTVYRAFDRASGEAVALKVLATGSRLDASLGDRFEQEARLLASLRHRNLVATRGGLGSEGEHAFYAMELVQGRSLAAVLAERGRLEPEAAVAAALEVLAGLEAAHGQGVVHRDVKPSNVLLDRTGAVKVADFGLARALDATRLTHTGQVLGTPAYMSPEQANAQPVDARTDVYAAGVLLWELLAGRPPFVAESPLAVLRLHVEAPVPPLPHPAPPGLEAIVRTALAKDPARRFASARAFAGALEALGVARPERLQELAGTAETAANLPVATPGTPTAGPALAPTVLEPVSPGPANKRPRQLRAPAPVLVLVLVLGAGALGARAWLAAPRPLVRIETSEGEVVEGLLATIDGASARVELADGTTREVPRGKIRRLAYR